LGAFLVAETFVLRRFIEIKIGMKYCRISLSKILSKSNYLYNSRNSFLIKKKGEENDIRLCQGEYTLQLDALNKYGCDRIFQEKMTGTKKERPELDEMIKLLRNGDKIVIYKLDRIGRSTKHIIELSETFEKMGVELVSIMDQIDTATAMGRFFFRFMASLAELERDIIRRGRKQDFQVQEPEVEMEDARRFRQKN
jgi:hypothetical protein